MTPNARFQSKWRFQGVDGTLSFILRSALWLIVIAMLILPLMGASSF